MALESSPLYAPFRPRWRGRHGWGVMAGSEATADFVQELLNLSPGRVRCFLDADFDGVRQSLESESPPFDCQSSFSSASKPFPLPLKLSMTLSKPWPPQHETCGQFGLRMSILASEDPPPTGLLSGCVWRNFEPCLACRQSGDAGHFRRLWMASSPWFRDSLAPHNSISFTWPLAGTGSYWSWRLVRTGTTSQG
jgi:hypothetical protein